jgi:integrase
MPNRRVASDLDAKIHVACCDGSWRQFKETLTRGDSEKQQPATLREFSKRYLEEYCKVRNRSWKCKRSAFQCLVRRLGDLKLNDLTLAQLDSYFRWRRESGVSYATLNRELAYLKHMMNYAQERGVIEVNPVARMKKFKEQRRERPRATDEEINRLLEYDDPLIRPMLGFMRETGCRPGEALSLKHTQIRRADRLVIFTDTTKSGKFRAVPLTEECLRWLDEMPVLPGCPYVFYDPKTRTRWKDIRKRFRKAIAAVGLDWMKPKDFRRFYGITLSENGAEMHVIQAMLGHASVRTTEEYYAHFSPHYAARRALQVLEGRKRADGRQMGGEGLAS